jgi:hypothetical protein
MPLGIIEAASFFGIVLALAVFELVRTRALIARERKNIESEKSSRTRFTEA